MAQTSSKASSTPSYKVVVDNSGSKPPPARIFSGTGGGGGGGQVDTETKNYLDAKVDAVRAQNDARFAEVVTRLESVAYKIDHAPKPLGLWQVAGLIATALVAGVTILGVFADRFDGGISATGLLDVQGQAQAERDAKQNEALESLFTAIQGMQAESSTPEP